MELQLIDLDRISTDGTQTRAGLREQAVAEYAELIQGGVRMMPAVVFKDGETLHLAAGFHRRAAYQRAGRKQMPCFVKEGTKWDAIRYGIRNNLKHVGERITRADKAHNIKLVLREKPEMSDSAIAELCGASPSTVGKYRAELASTFQIEESPARVGRDGRTIDTSNLGRRPSSGPTQPPEGAGDEGPGAEPAPDAEHCRCGGAWMSDGHGGRFCEKCHAGHPENAEPYPDDREDLLQSRPATKPAAGPSKAIELFEQTVKGLGVLKRHVCDFAEVCPGPNRQRMLALLNKAGDVLEAWRGEAGIPKEYWARRARASRRSQQEALAG